MRIFNDVKQHVLFFLDVGQKKKKQLQAEAPRQIHPKGQAARK